MKYINFKALLFSIVIVFTAISSKAQKTAIYDQPGAYYQQALELYNKQQYGPSQNLFQKSIKLIKDPYSIMRINAEYYKALCAVELFNDDAELLLLQFIDAHPESMHIKHIYFQLGKFQYRKRGFRRALKSFKKVDVFDLTKEEQIEFYFKRGYSYFKRDSIELAKKSFYEILNKDSKYKAPATYYYSHIAYTEANYETARKGFMSLKDNKAFSPMIPYYVTHIYYMQKKYDELLKVAPKLLEKSIPKRQPEIARIIGESYYRTGRYTEAIPYLDRFYNSSQNNISSTNLYQMAYANYKTKNYEKAISYFKKIDDKNKEILQSSYYHLAICYINIGKKPFALTSFKDAYKMNIDADITADALYNFAKLSYELDYNPYNQALKAFEKYVTEYPESSHRSEAMTYLTKMYLSTNNYSQALVSIEKIQSKSPELLYAYQRILYSVAVQLFNSGKYKNAITHFDKAIALKTDRSFTAKSYYWKAESKFRLKKYSASIRDYNTFLTSAGAFSDPNYNQAHYNIGYAYFHQKKYKESNHEFRIYVQNQKDAQSVFVNDAYNRIGDSYFIQKEYALAIQNYDNAISIGKRNIDYALYKKAEALGPMKMYAEKAATFEKLITEHPTSTYTGNAEYALAQLYNVVINDLENAKKHYYHIIATYPMQTSFVKKSKLDLGYIYNNTDSIDQAIHVLKKLYIDYKGSEESNQALSKLQSIYADNGNVDLFFDWAKKQGVTVKVSTQDSANYFVAEEAYMSAKYQEAIKSLGHYIERFPTGYFISKAHYYRAECERNTEKYAEALKDYQYIIDQPVSKYTENSVKQVCDINYKLFKDYPAARVSYTKLREITESKKMYSEATINIMRCDWNTESYNNILESAQGVLNLPELDDEIKLEANMNMARVYVMNTNWVAALPIFNQVSKNNDQVESAEALYNLAYYDYINQNYDSAEAKAFKVIQQKPSYEYWVVKALVLSADIFVETDNIHQAKATLASVVDNYDGDQELLQLAKDKLKKVNKLSNKPKTKAKATETVIDLGKDNNLFIDFEFEKDNNFEEESEEEIEE